MSESRKDVITIERMAHSAQAVGRREDGKVVLVLGGAPGDRVRVELIKEHKRYVEAVVVEVIEAGPERRPPPCEHRVHDQCGGCTWMHLTEGEQLRQKEMLVRREVGRISEAALVRPIRSDVPRFAYRRRTRLGYREDALGFRRHGQRRIFDLRQCLVLAPALNDSLDEVRRAVAGRGSGNVDVVADADGAVTIGGTARHFLQPSAATEEVLIELVLEAVGPEPGLVAELFCGSGTFTEPLAQHARLVRAWEGERAAIERLRRRCPQVQAYVADLIKGDISPDLGRPDVVVLDPPRKGAARCVPQIVASGSPVVVYVSCEPTTLCRDLKSFVQAGYQIDWVQPIDAFPQTHHVESVARLSRAGNSTPTTTSGMLDTPETLA